jgi:DNA-binding transcriptional ArsR family regulator
MEKPLKPTLWRTARALANSDRLNLMYLVSTAKGTKGVVELAAEANLPVPTASIYLRTLNARGLISVVRSGPYVYYGTGSDRSLPVAMSIQESFRRLFARKSMPTGWTGNLLPLLRAYSNPRRESILRLLRNFQPMRYSELRKLSGLCETSFLRHLDILTAARIVESDTRGSYSLAKPKNSLAFVFLDALDT